MNLYHSNRIKQLIEQWLEHAENTANKEIFDTEFNFSEETGRDMPMELEKWRERK